MANMKTSQTGIDLIQSYEGCILHAYDDHNDRIVQPGQACIGTITIGFGHTDAAGPPAVTPGMTISKDVALQILADDLAPVEKEVMDRVHVDLNQNQFDALVSFQFNTGWLGHSSCSLLRHLNEGNYAAAAQNFMLYDEASGRVLTGLKRRRQAEKNLFETPA
jgi:lysozyme